MKDFKSHDQLKNTASLDATIDNGVKYVFIGRRAKLRPFVKCQLNVLLFLLYSNYNIPINTILVFLVKSIEDKD